jgi:hypothetical protein
MCIQNEVNKSNIRISHVDLMTKQWVDLDRMSGIQKDLNKQRRPYKVLHTSEKMVIDNCQRFWREKRTIHVFGPSPLPQSSQENSSQIVPDSRMDNGCRHMAWIHSQTSSQKPEGITTLNENHLKRKQWYFIKHSHTRQFSQRCVPYQYFGHDQKLGLCLDSVRLFGITMLLYQL